MTSRRIPQVAQQVTQQQVRQAPMFIDETMDEGRRMRQKKKLLTGGQRSTILFGIQSALKKRLGE